MAVIIVSGCKDHTNPIGIQSLFSGILSLVGHIGPFCRRSRPNPIDTNETEIPVPTLVGLSLLNEIYR
ncbi:hypothetical protein [uncultured Alistipes sp.]|uniref:hypothetical protein n=1 Tax=uncultured Alistipes sp. TaxID=538949 RepID=UPI00272B65E0|nr:hypothetical protein [uncultured Alistipes sp.]